MPKKGKYGSVSVKRYHFGILPDISQEIGVKTIMKAEKRRIRSKSVK